MKLTAQVKLLPTPEQAQALRDTLQRANEVCNRLSAWAWDHKSFGKFAIQRACYAAVRAETDLASQLVIRCISKVADAYTRDKKTYRTFKPLGCIAYDSRILRWFPTNGSVSIGTVAGRQAIPFVCSDRQRDLLTHQKGESDLVFRNGAWYLYATCVVTEAAPSNPSAALGIDLGIKNIAVDSDGHVFSGAAVNHVRHRHRRLRGKLQKKGTKAAKRRLRRLSGKERRFARWVNHNLSKQIVLTAQGTNRAIALEDLQGIRMGTTVKKSQRSTLHSWAFHQLRAFIDYKARWHGVPVLLVDPRNTSRTCPDCGCIDKRNRPSQSVFSCVNCGLAGLADHIAAVNIGRRAAVTPPDFSSRPATVTA